MRSKWFPGIHAKRDEARHDRRMREQAAWLAQPVRNPVCYSCKAKYVWPTTPDESWIPCCNAACLQAWSAESNRRNEVAAARYWGVPVAEYRKAKAG